MKDETTITRPHHLTATAADESPALVYLAGLSPGSRRTMRQTLDMIAFRLTGGTRDAADMVWGALRRKHTQKLRADLAGSGMAPTTANKYLAALRGVLKEAWRLEQIGTDDYRRAVDIKRVKGETLLAGRGLSAAEVRALFSSCPDSPAGARDAALLAVLYGAGIRRSEAVALELSDYSPEDGAVTIRHGKGNKARTVYATNGGKRALDHWLTIRGPEAGPLFCRVDKAGAVHLERITGQAVLWILRRAAERAGVPRFSPHDLRRSFISDMLAAGVDVVTVQHLAGHANPATTSRYDRRPEETKRQAAGMLHVPYSGPGA